MTSKLTWHLQNIPGWAHSVINNDPVKLIDPPSDNPLPGRRIIGRVYMDDWRSNEMCAQGRAGARQWWAAVSPLMLSRPYVWAWCLPNEPQPVANWDFCNQLADFTLEAAAIMHGHGLKVIGGELAEGNPGGATDTERANLFCAIARGLVACDYWSQHAYWMPDGYPHPEAGYNQWHALRYQMNRGYARARGIPLPPFIGTEGGWDFTIGGEPRQGWVGKAAWSVYLEDLKRFDADLMADPDCLGATLFVSGANLDWLKFEIGESESRSMASYISSAPPAPAPTFAQMLAVAFGAQFHDLRYTLPHSTTSSYVTRSLSEIERVILHHTATAQSTTWETVARYHVNSLDWPGIGYHIGVHADGRVSLLNDPETISYHAGTANSSSVAISVMGNYQTDTVSDAIWQRILEVNAVLVSYIGRALPLVGHRDAPGNATVCPGANLYARLTTPEVPPMPTDPRASNCKAYHLNAAGQVDGIELVYQPNASAKYACIAAQLIDEAAATGNTVVKVDVFDANGIKAEHNPMMVWPYGQPMADDAPAPAGNTDNRFTTTSVYIPPAIGPLGFVVVDAAGAIISDAIWGYGLPNGHHISGYVAFKERGEVVPPVDPTYPTFEASVRGEAEKHDVLSINPNAALCKAGAAAGLWPTSNEYVWTYAGVSYTGQRFRNPANDAVTAFFCVTGDWGHVLRQDW